MARGSISVLSSQAPAVHPRRPRAQWSGCVLLLSFHFSLKGLRKRFGSISTVSELRLSFVSMLAEHGCRESIHFCRPSPYVHAGLRGYCRCFVAFKRWRHIAWEMNQTVERHTCLLLSWFLGSYYVTIQPKQVDTLSPGVAQQPGRKLASLGVMHLGGVFWVTWRTGRRVRTYWRQQRLFRAHTFCRFSFQPCLRTSLLIGHLKACLPLIYTCYRSPTSYGIHPKLSSVCC